MKKLFLSLVAAMLVSMSAMAQQAVAVLTHDGTSKTFNGYTALQDAYAASASGDLITLSSGTFGSISTVGKAITIRGAGMAYDSIYNTQPTIISGNIILNIPDTETMQFLMEGVFHNDIVYYKHTQHKPQFVKCRLYDVDRLEYTELGTKETGKMVDANFLQCKIVCNFRLNKNSSASLINCYVRHPTCVNDTTSVFFLKNCNVAPYPYSSNATALLYSSTCVNCIFMKSVTSTGLGLKLNDNTLFSNCLIYKGTTPDKSKNSYTNFDTMESVFQTYTGSYTEDEQFLLRDEVKTTSCDELGREIGMNGGDFPFTTRVAGPHLKLFNADAHSTTDGKLRVRLQVDTTIE